MRSRALHLPIAFELRHVYKAISFALVLTVLLFWAFVLRPVSLGGPAGYVLVSGTSMNPLYHTGDMVFVLHHDTYHVGDIIAYKVPNGDPMAGAQVIHRIIGGNPKNGWIVQGDNRSAPDVWRPHNTDIVGAATLHIPNAVIVLQYLRSPVFIALLAACFVFVNVLTRADTKQNDDADIHELPQRDELKDAA
jgi:signal peptidase